MLSICWSISLPAGVRCSEVFLSGVLSTENALEFFIKKGPLVNSYLRNLDTPQKMMVIKFHLTPRGITENQILDVIDALDKIIVDHSQNQLEKTYYRGESLPIDTKFTEGQEVPYKSYISLTRDKNLATNYAKSLSSNQIPVLYEVSVGPGKLGAQINNLAPQDLRNQDEFLLPRNSTLSIVQAIWNGEIFLVKAHLK